MNTLRLHLVIVLPWVLAMLLLAACSTPIPPVSAVTVRRPNSELVKELSPMEVAEFDRHWRARKPLPAATPAETYRRDSHYRLSITKGEHSSIWYYDTNGRSTLLTIKAGTPDYQIQDIRAFNKLIGASR